MTGWFDALTHLDDPRSAAVDGVLQRAAAAGVVAVLSAGVDPRTAGVLPEGGYGVRLWRAYGIHPQNLELDALPAQLTALERCLARPGVVALGEMGLDARSGMPPAALQEQACLAQLRLANRLRLPVVVHCVRAMGRLVALLDAVGELAAGGLVHGFAGPAELVPTLAAHGLYFSFGALVCRSEAKRCRRAARVVPLDRLLVETDAPDPAPRGFDAAVGEPAAVPWVGRALARLRDVPVDAIAVHTTANALRLFQLGGA